MDFGVFMSFAIYQILYNRQNSNHNRLYAPSKHEAFVYHLYNVEPTSKTLGRRFINVIQMFCVYWVSLRMENLVVLYSDWTLDGSINRILNNLSTDKEHLYYKNLNIQDVLLARFSLCLHKSGTRPIRACTCITILYTISIECNHGNRSTPQTCEIKCNKKRRPLLNWMMRDIHLPYGHTMILSADHALYIQYVVL